MVVNDPAAGKTDRIHISNDSPPPIDALVSRVEPHLWLNTQADQLVVDSGEVVGAWVTRLETGEQGWIQAESTVVATGGFARDLDRVREDRPELADVDLVVEAAPTSLGIGLSMLEEIGVEIQNQGQFGVYLHSIADPRAERLGEALWVFWAQESIIVDKSGRRVADEGEVRGFGMVEYLEAVEDQKLWVFSSAEIADKGLDIPAYLWTNPDEQESIGLEEALDMGAIVQGETPSELAALLGIDGEGLEAELADYALMVEAGEDSAFGKSPQWLTGLGPGPFVGAPMVAGAAKSFVGARIDVDTRVVDVHGDVIPGLFAVGEAAGFLGSEAVGSGFSGSITACYLTGRVAGREVLK